MTSHSTRSAPRPPATHGAAMRRRGATTSRTLTGCGERTEHDAVQQPNGAVAPAVLCDPVAAARGSFGNVRPPQNLMNSDSFIAGQKKYFASSYEQFERFGGPCVYFHQECLRAGATAFLSLRHIETLYATLAAWGMHRMGGTDRTKTKLTDWTRFCRSINANAGRLEQFRGCTMLRTPEDEYLEAVDRLRPVYETLDLTLSEATVVVNSKALHHQSYRCGRIFGLGW